MLDNLINLVKEHAGSAIINNNDIPNEKNDLAIKTTADSILDSLKSQASSGGSGLDSITNLFSKGNFATSALSSVVMSAVVSNLTKKLGINQSQATNVASGLIPTVMDKLVKKTNDPNDNSFDMGGILKTIAGGNLGGIADKLKNLF